MSNFEWTADAEYVMEEAGDVCTVSGRTYKKVNSGKALVGAYYNGYTGPLLVSTEPQAVTYSALNRNFTYIGTIEYLGQTWYISNTEYFMGGNADVTGYAKKISNENLTYLQAAQLIFELANVKENIPEDILYLIFDEYSNKYYNIVNNELNELDIASLSSSEFIEYGNTSIPDGFVIMKLSKPSILYWRNSEDELPVLNAKVTALPNSQSIYTNNIDISDPSITGIEKVTAEYTGTPYIACSFDAGLTWKSFDSVSKSWVILSAQDTGMIISDFLEIPINNWNEVIQGLSSFEIRFTLSSKEDTLKNIVFDFTN